MMRRSLHAAALSFAALALVAGTCGGGDGGGGSPSVREISDPVIDVPPAFDFADPTPLCAAVSSGFPPGFDFVPGDPNVAWVVDFAPPTLVPFRVDGARPQIGSTPPPFVLPFDSDGNGIVESVLAPILDDIAIVAADLALVTASNYEEVLFFSPQTGRLKSFTVSVAAGVFVKADNPLLPDPGTSAPRTGLSTFACVRPPPGALDSRGDPIAISVPSAGFCDATTPSYLSTFTSGAAIAAGHLFVSTSNLGDGAGSADTQYLPGSVLVYDVDTLASTVSPNAAVPVILTSAFNPTQVTAYSAAGRDFVLITASGAIGIEADDPRTPEIEGGGLALSEAAIDVIDAQTLELVATYPLGLAALAGGPLAIDASGRVAFVGSVASRNLFAVDLDPLPLLPTNVSAAIVLDAIVFDASAPFEIPGLGAAGAALLSCPGSSTGFAFNAAGDLLYASDACDGTLAVIGADLAGDPPVPVPPDRFSLLELTPIASPLRPDTLGDPRSPGRLAVRPGQPGVDYAGRDLFYLIGLDEGALCSIGVESAALAGLPTAVSSVASAKLSQSEPQMPNAFVRGVTPSSARSAAPAREFDVRVVPREATGELLIADLSGRVFGRFALPLRADPAARAIEISIAPAAGERAVLVAQARADGRRSDWRRVDFPPSSARGAQR